jgi:hypothetical protein
VPGYRDQAVSLTKAGPQPAREPDCIHNRARLYHVHSKALYHVVGDAGSRYRRLVSPRLAIERLMLLDAVLTTPGVEWITTAVEKAAYLARLTASASAATSQTSSPEGDSTHVVALPGALPIGVESDGRTVLLYLATEVWTDAFRTFLQGHATLFPRPLDRVYDAYQTVIHEELESPLPPATIAELKWYFEHRDKATREPVHPQDQRFLDVGARVFDTARFSALYQQWLKRGAAVFEGRSSPVIAEALNTGAGRVESLVLPHTYRHLSPLL